MSESTNDLVTRKSSSRRLVAPVSALAGAFALGAVLFAGHGTLHQAAAAMPSFGASAAEPAPQERTALTDLDTAMEQITAKVTPSVVRVDVTSRGGEQDGADGQSGDGQGDGQGSGQANPHGNGQQGDPLSQLPPELRRFFGNPGQGGGRIQPQQPQLERGVGSGVIISQDGYIVTNNHVVAGATQIRVTMSDRRIFTGKVVGTDPLTDIAVVKIPATGLVPATWGDSTHLIPGQTVLAFGSPFGYLQFSVTRGIISAINRQDPFRNDARKPEAFIQVDAAINPGNSGGPLVNSRGELIGINNAIISNTGSFEGVGFAIPAQIARSTAEQIIQHGKVEHGYLGIGMNNVTPDNAHFFSLNDASGAIVTQVTPGSPAAAGGVKRDDVIRTFNGVKIEDSSALQIAVSELRPGTPIELGLLRNGQKLDVHLTVGSFDAAKTMTAKDDQPAGAPGKANTGRLGLAVADLSADARQQVQVPADVHGVVVEQVRPGSPAEDAGLAPGDVIEEVNRQPATSAAQFSATVKAVPAGKTVLLLVWSRGGSSYRTMRTGDQNG